MGSGPHSNLVIAEWLELKHARMTGQIRQVDGQNLTIADVIAVSRFHVSINPIIPDEVVKQVEDSAEFLHKQLADGVVIYGVTTGFGGSADTRTRSYDLLQSSAIQHLNVGVLRPTDKGLPPPDNSQLLRSHALPCPIVRASMLIRFNSLLRGHSGVRYRVVELLSVLLIRYLTPVVPLRGSISASGDLSTLSYIAGTLEGNPDIFVRVGIGADIMPADQALAAIDIQPIRLQAKEGLGITNGTAPSCGAAAVVMHEANRLALLTQALTAMATDVLNGTASNYHPFLSAVRPHGGQAEAAATILAFLHCSSSLKDNEPGAIGLAQDRYALRTAPQWIGPQLEDLLLATQQVTAELNSTTDNPLIDAANKRIHHGGNFQAMAITSAMEKTMLALQNLGRLLFAQSSELINNMTNKGLPPNLSADEPSVSFTFKGFDVNMAAYMAELAYLARPISSHVQVAEMANQSVNSMALVAARYALEAVEVLSLMAATYIYALCQAVDLRCIEGIFKSAVEKEVLGLQRQHLPVSGPKEKIKVEFAMTEGLKSALSRWDELSHLDTPQRSRVVAKHFVGEIVHDMSQIDTNCLAALRDFEVVIRTCLEARYRTVRQEYCNQHMHELPLGGPGLSITTSRLGRAGFGIASSRVYVFVRQSLGIPLHRGVVEHPPLREQTLGINSSPLAPNGIDGSVQGPRKILGTMAGEIYEAIRNGTLTDAIIEVLEVVTKRQQVVVG